MIFLRYLNVNKLTLKGLYVKVYMFRFIHSNVLRSKDTISLMKNYEKKRKKKTVFYLERKNEKIKKLFFYNTTHTPIQRLQEPFVLSEDINVRHCFYGEDSVIDKREIFTNLLNEGALYPSCSE